MRFVDGVIVETVGDEYVALTPDGVAVRLSGDVAKSVHRMLHNPSAVTDSDRELLLSTGVVNSEASGLSRRGVVLGGAAAVGAGVAALSFPAAAAAASVTLQGTEIWGDYQAISGRMIPEFTEDGQRTGEEFFRNDFVSVWVYVSKETYDAFRGVGNYPASAGWPDSLSPFDSWRLVFGSQSLALEAQVDDSEGDGEVQELVFIATKDQTDKWNQAIYDFLKDDWAATRTIELLLTNGTTTVPVTLYAYPDIDNLDGDG